MEGTFIGHYKGFGFVEVEDQEQDIFIPENDTGSAMHQDMLPVMIYTCNFCSIFLCQFNVLLFIRTAHLS